jgi:hypothetical protein
MAATPTTGKVIAAVADGARPSAARGTGSLLLAIILAAAVVGIATAVLAVGAFVAYGFGAGYFWPFGVGLPSPWNLLGTIALLLLTLVLVGKILVHGLGLLRSRVL